MKNISRRFRSGSLGRNTLWMLGGNGLRLVIQSAYFVLIARSLEPTEYGAFVAVVAVAAIVSPFVGVGTGNLIIRNVARDPDSFSRSWGNGLLVTLSTGILATGLVLSCTFLLPAHVHRIDLVFIALADLICGGLLYFCGAAFSALSRFSITAQINVWWSLSRIIGLAILISIKRHPSVDDWAAAYLLATFVTSTVVLAIALSLLRKPSLQVSEIWPELREGFFFSFGLSAQSIYNDIDKTMLARLGDLTSTGIYGAAYRIIDVSLVPLRSLLAAANPGFFRAGHQGGVKETLRYMRRMLLHTVGYAVAVVVGLLLFAPIIPHILGSQYARSVSALRWLALLPFLKTVHSFFADALTGAGHQRMRTAIQVFVAIFNVLINLWIIPAYSWVGAAWSSLASDGLLMCLMATAAFAVLRRQESQLPLLEEAA
ncbi:MAG: oligosaccharide flippase family protein [Acidobacteriaceae bacterium]